jgi:hypothetical protein
MDALVSQKIGLSRAITSSFPALFGKPGEVISWFNLLRWRNVLSTRLPAVQAAWEVHVKWQTWIHHISDRYTALLLHLSFHASDQKKVGATGRLINVTRGGWKKVIKHHVRVLIAKFTKWCSIYPHLNLVQYWVQAQEVGWVTGWLFWGPLSPLPLAKPYRIPKESNTLSDGKCGSPLVSADKHLFRLVVLISSKRVSTILFTTLIFVAHPGFEIPQGPLVTFSVF